MSRRPIEFSVNGVPLGKVFIDEPFDGGTGHDPNVIDGEVVEEVEVRELAASGGKEDSEED